ncbi:MAG TPA: hypothetical protein VFE14_13165 [Micromonosporaceae bacterium]|nr:hypothetical protein [Micromonosporaceae bacterium]
MTGSVDAALREIGNADVVAFGGVGLMGRVLPPTEAFLELSDAIAGGAGQPLRARLDSLLAGVTPAGSTPAGSTPAGVTPAGKVYAALLLGQLDPAAGRAAWQRLARERAEFTTFSGCLMNKTTLAEYAADQLA